MKVAVIGGGIIGSTSVYALLEGGYEVTLIDRAYPDDGIATNVNAGLICPGHSLAWASPQMLRRLPAIITNRTPQLRVRAPLDPALLRWGMTFLRNCTSTRARRTTLLRGRLGKRSRELLDEQSARLGIECGRTQGMVFLHADEEALTQQHAAMQLLRDDGHELHLIDRESCLALEPSLADSDLPIAGGIHHTSGMTANSAMFSAALRSRSIEAGLRLVSADVSDLIIRDGRVMAARTKSGDEVEADAFVVAAGAHSPRLLGPQGRKLGLYPVRGYGLTWADLPADIGPHLGGIDETNLIAWSRTGTSLRVTGIAEFNRLAKTQNRKDVEQVHRTATRRFPSTRDLGDPRVESGFRPMTADGLPRIGKWGDQNLFVNTGHGNLGWTLANASAELLVSAIDGRHTSDPLALALAP